MVFDPIQECRIYADLVWIKISKKALILLNKNPQEDLNTSLQIEIFMIQVQG